MNILSLFSNTLSPIKDMYVSRQDRKILAETSKAKLLMAKQDGNQQIQLSQAEWESLALRGNEDSWKDEYVTITMTLWIWLIFVGSLVAAFTGKTEILDGTISALKVVKELNIDVGFLTEVVVLAAVGHKAIKKLL